MLEWTGPEVYKKVHTVPFATAVSQIPCPVCKEFLRVVISFFRQVLETISKRPLGECRGGEAPSLPGAGGVPQI